MLLRLPRPRPRHGAAVADSGFGGYSLACSVLQCAYTMASDIWSVGALLYELCTLCPPFNSIKNMELLGMKEACRLEPIDKNLYSKELIELVMSMLE
eukprot:899815-Pyramimonas_sp.AAC.1